MNKYLEIFQRQLNSFYSNLDKKQKIRMAVLAVLLIVVIVVAAVLLTRTEYTVLYSNLDPSETSQIYSELSAQGIPTRVSANDTIIEVPADQADAIRMDFISRGIPETGLQYDQMSSGGLGSTNQTTQINYTIMLQENLRTSIKTMNKVTEATVLLQMEDDSPFVLSSDKKDARASISLQLAGDAKLTNEEALSIAQLTMGAVPNLALENVHIVDTMMNTYRLLENDTMGDSEDQYALRNSTQNQLEEAIEELLTPVFGTNNALATVYIELDFDETITETSTVSPPEGFEEGLVISMKRAAEAIRGATVEGQVGLDANGGAAPTYETIGSNDDLYWKTSEEVNYVLNETKEQVKKAKGSIDKITASVLLNSDALADGVDYTDDVSELVRTALGITGVEEVAQLITVRTIPFQPDTSAEDAHQRNLELLNASNQAALIRNLILAGAILLSALLIFLMVRSVMQSRRAREMAELAAAEAAAQAEIAALAIEEGPTPEEQELLDAITPVRDEVTVRIEEFIERDPAAAAHLLRGWLAED